ncbi:MAG: peptidylprolyl isomerase [Bacteroidota bacterium]|nr:peptidylprolyl isomerase [Bacteroidota bacterium]
MRYFTIITIILILGFGFFDSCDKNDIPDTGPYETIRITTKYGDIRIWLHYKTPLHRENFIKLTNDDFYDSLIFHRVVNNFIIQGGDPEGDGTGGPGYKIEEEINNSLRHDYGAVGAARLPDDMNPDKESNGSQFYIVENPFGTYSLDGDYTIFGYVFLGMDVVSKIAEVETNYLEKPISKVYMMDVEVEKYTKQELKDNFDFDISDL